MREIKLYDPVVMIELWPEGTTDQNTGTGPLVPDQSTQDCRLYGFCIAVNEDGTIMAAPELESSPNEAYTNGLIFPVYPNIPANAKPGTSIAFHADDAQEMFPLIQI